MKKVKVAFFSDVLLEDLDGAMRTMFQILDRVDHSRFEFRLFCGIPPKDSRGMKVVQLTAAPIPLAKGYKMVIPFLCCKKILNELEEFKPDVIHFASPSMLADFLNQYGKEKNIPVVTIYHTHFLSYVKYYFRYAKFLIPYFTRWVERRAYKVYNPPAIVFVPTREVMRELMQECHLDGHNLVLWQRGLNGDIFNSSKRDVSYIRSIVKNDLPVALFVSRLVWEKNLGLLIAFYKLCQSRGEQMNLVIAGDGPARKEMQRQMPGAIFLGTVDHVTLAKLYASSDVFFFPSDTETYGNVLIEAMACGLPCVAANRGGHMDFMKHGENSLLCDPTDPEEFLEAIKQLIRDQALREKVIKNGLDYTHSLEWTPLVNAYLNAIQGLVPSSQPADSVRELTTVS